MECMWSQIADDDKKMRKCGMMVMMMMNSFMLCDTCCWVRCPRAARRRSLAHFPGYITLLYTGGLLSKILLMGGHRREAQW